MWPKNVGINRNEESDVIKTNPRTLMLRSCWMKRCRKIQGVTGGRRACWFVAWEQAVVLFERQLVDGFDMNTQILTVCEFLDRYGLWSAETACVEYCLHQSDLMKLSMPHFPSFYYHGWHSIPCKYTADKECSVFAKALLCCSRGIVEWFILTTVVRKQLAPHWTLASAAAVCLHLCTW